MDKGEIKSVQEYDFLLSRSKTMALDAASLTNTKEYMVQYLDDDKVR